MTSIFKYSKSCQVKEVNLILENANAQNQKQWVKYLERQIWAQYQQEISDNQNCLQKEQAILESLELPSPAGIKTQAGQFPVSVVHGRLKAQMTVGLKPQGPFPS